MEERQEQQEERVRPPRRSMLAFSLPCLLILMFVAVVVIAIGAIVLNQTGMSEIKEGPVLAEIATIDEGRYEVHRLSHYYNGTYQVCVIVTNTENNEAPAAVDCD